MLMSPYAIILVLVPSNLKAAPVISLYEELELMVMVPPAVGVVVSLPATKPPPFM